ncbi:MAG: RNA-binding protein [Candidatus Thermoplasmatota archaeon]|nr:RNA-binding protein [Euryarchaeota archaeon]MBU4032526.1 RNA-binding protein [Candidatus Thermoplasmatota archaeon]MBU4072056.1 RNA-binding protein [Candidatus Thermoplasmatota archaeon]MBU4144608.1 RNA-binding protein [Candidatus Thermoplasmatota archaeon]MBU4592368.1 RNA-binding protein [Candidatus Thermoplasmatota archaeon]
MAMPLNILERHTNKIVMLTLKDGRTLEGKLIGFDEYMNMILEDTEETRDGQVKRLGTVVLRGNNIVTIVPK